MFATYNNIFIHCPSHFNFLVIFFFTFTIYLKKNEFLNSYFIYHIKNITYFHYPQMMISYQYESIVQEILDLQLLERHLDSNQMIHH